uniref:Uncharacterized protein n=1 Tax=virus sp. ctLpa4 TaxID=2825814 RepID=A0A8S5RLZ4_9VIRU|nr:MAG TPA: hypothetical protein [virus sp. ctLpa4]
MAFSPYWSKFVPQLYLAGGVARFDFLSAACNSFQQCANKFLR